MSKSLATWFTPSLNVKSRSNGSSAVNSAAYRACITLHDERTGLTHSYSRKRGHIETLVYDGDGFSSLNENRELTFNKISSLWNKAESADTRCNSRTMREVIIPLPDDFTDAQNIELSKDYAKHLRDTYGVAVQASLHGKNKKNRNTHLHLAFTTRAVNDTGEFSKKKTRELDKRDGKGNSNNEISKLREALCAITNRHAEMHGMDWYVYAGKFSEIEGMEDHVSTKHIPINATKDKRAEIEATNEMTQAIYKAKQTIKLGKAELEKLQNDLKREDEQRQEHAVNVPVVAPVVKSEPEPLEKIDIEPDWKRAVEYQAKERLRQRELIKQREDWETYLKNLETPQPEMNFFGFETKRSKQAAEAWNRNGTNALNQIKIHTDAINQINEELSNPRLLKQVELYHKVTAHNENVDTENARLQLAAERAIKQEQPQEQLAPVANEKLPLLQVAPPEWEDWGAKLDALPSSSHRPHFSSDDLTMRP